MESSKVSDEEMLRMINERPQIRQRLISLLAAVHDTAGDLRRADDAEQRLSQELRRLGQEAMQAWADEQVQATEREVRRGGRAAIARVKKTPVAHHVRRYLRDRTAVPQRQQEAAPVCTQRRRQGPGLLAPAATGAHRSCGRPALCQGDGQAGRALWHRDRREHHPQGHLESRSGDPPRQRRLRARAA